MEPQLMKNVGMETTENYQLKWHSFANHIHSSVASSLNSSAFTDAILYTLDGHQIPAHRFVLSACSQHLHHIFKTHPKITTTLPVVIVMPPEINHKTLTTLLQYMYCGETTVSKDILESVLRGGDILKIKGLWRPREGEEQTQEKPDEHHRQKKIIKPYDNKRETERHRSDTKEFEKIKKVKVVSLSKSAELKNKSEQTTSAANSAAAEPENSNGNARKKIRKDEVEDAVPAEDPVSEDEKGDFLVIKEEPIEWEEFHDVDLSESDLYQAEMTIKPEIVFRDEGTNDEEYSPLTCELCSEIFMQPAEWVRHIQTHTDMQPARRQRRGSPSVDNENATFPPLQCDLCQQQFPTPAEWVRHIQNTHTEHELAMLNNSSSNSSRNNRAYRMSGVAQKTCNVCNKTFPSHASMLIHRRTHTGEKPYTCELCQKGFNVKSNLLRHLRTLHDKIINSADVSDIKENSSESQS